MLCECIPIGSSVNIIPKIIGGNGLILEKRKIEDLKSLVKSIIKIENKNTLRKQARNHIVKKYNINNRVEKIISLIESNNL